MASDPELAVVIGGFVNALGLVRALGAMNRRIVVISNRSYDIANYSRYVHEYRRIDDLERCPERLLSLLEENAPQWHGGMVFPTNDEAIAALHAYREKLSSRYRLNIPPPEATPYILEKIPMLNAAEETGIPLPKCYGLADETGAIESALRFPVVVKPVNASEFSLRFDRKLFLIRDKKELEDCTRLLSASGTKGQVFDLVPGPDSAIYIYCVYLDRKGVPLAECTVQKLRQTPPFFGISRVARLTRNIPLLKEQTLAFLRRIGYQGFAAAEYKRDERDGVFRFLEVNGRSIVYNSLLRKANFDLTRLAWEEQAGGSVKPVGPVEWPGAWIHLHADLLRSLQNWRKEGLSLSAYFEPYLGPKTWAVWEAGDNRPFYRQWNHSLNTALRFPFQRNWRAFESICHTSDQP